MKNILKILLLFAILIATIQIGLAQPQSVRRVINPGPLQHTLTSAGTTHCAGTPGPNIYLATSSTNTSCQLWQMLSPTSNIPIGPPLLGTGGIVNFGAQNDGTYFCIVTNLLTSCSDTMIGYVTITSMPIPTVDITASGPLTGCGTVNVALSTPYEVGCTYQWQRNGINIPFANSNIYNASVTNTTEVYSVIADNGTCSNSDFVIVEAHPLPQQFVVSTTTPTFCQGSSGGSVDVSNTITGIHYQLLNGTTPIGGPIVGINGPYQWTGLTQAGIYTVVATNPITGCTSVMNGSAVLTMNPLPAAAGTITGPANVCQNSTATYNTTNIANATSYVWAVPNGATILTGQGTTQINVLFNGNTSGNVSVFGHNACGGGQPSTLSIAVNVAPSLTVTANPANICAGSSSTLTASGTGTSFLWTGGATTQSIQVTPSTTTTYAVTATGSNGCSASANTTVTVHPAPNVSLVLSPSSLCTDVNSAVLTGGTPTGGTYSGSCVFGGNTVYPPVSGTGTYIITYTYTDGNGCTNSATDLFVINPTPVVSFGNITGQINTDTPPFDLVGFVMPQGGTFSGPGVISGSSIFNPALAGGGTHMLTYHYVHPITGCSASQIQYVTVHGEPSGLENVTTAVDAVRIFPNPASEVLNLTGINTKEIEALKIYDPIGKVVYSTVINEESMTIDVKNFSAGIYIIRFTSVDGFSATKRLIKSE